MTSQSVPRIDAATAGPVPAASSALDAAGTGPAVAASILGTLWLVIAIAVLYPAFQAMVLRWWISGLRFGELTVTSHLRTGSVYGLYWRFVWMSLLLGLALGIAGGIAAAIVWAISAADAKSAGRELLQGAILIGIY